MVSNLFERFHDEPSAVADPYATGGLRVWDDYQFRRKGIRGSGGPPSRPPVAVIQPPVNILAPIIVEPSPMVGEILTVDIGEWTGTEPIVYTYEWWREPAVAPTGPVNVVLPDVSGSEIEDQTLHCDTGTWDGTPPLTYSYQWYRLVGLANTALPDISGTEMEDQTLGCTTGTWTGSEPITYSYQWYRVEEALRRNIHSIKGRKRRPKRRPPRRPRRGR